MMIVHFWALSRKEDYFAVWTSNKMYCCINAFLAGYWPDSDSVIIFFVLFCFFNQVV